jgi:hypothetical protein
LKRTGKFKIDVKCIKSDMIVPANLRLIRQRRLERVTPTQAETPLHEGRLTEMAGKFIIPAL